MWFWALLFLKIAVSVWFLFFKKPPIPRRSDGQTVLVTGAASGIGRCVALRLNALGYRVFAADVNKAGLEELKRSTPQIEIETLDVTSEASVQAIAAKMKEQALYGVVNVAGIIHSQPCLTCTEEQMQAIFQVNVFGPIRLIRSLFPALLASKGVIINVASVAGRVAWPWQGYYSATKHAVEGYTDLLRREIGRFGIKAVLIEPGAVMTPMVDIVRKGRQEWIEQNPESIFCKPMEKMVGKMKKNVGHLSKVAVTPEQVAETIAVALGSSNPHTRYVVATPIFGVLFQILCYLPDKWTDVFMDKIGG